MGKGDISAKFSKSEITRLAKTDDLYLNKIDSVVMKL